MPGVAGRRKTKKAGIRISLLNAALFPLALLQPMDAEPGNLPSSTGTI
jgi:1,6-anhydro-N-acetylmuramate kinase